MHTKRLFRVYAEDRNEAISLCDRYLDEVTENPYAYGIDYGSVIGGVCPDGTVFSVRESDTDMPTDKLKSFMDVDAYVARLEKSIGSYKEAKQKVADMFAKLPEDKHDASTEWLLKQAVQALQNAPVSGKIDKYTDFVFAEDLSEPGISEVYQTDIPQTKEHTYFIFTDCHS